MAAGGGAPVGVDDAALLAPLTDESFLDNLRARYQRDVIYTYVGASVVCVNPGRALPLYSAEAARRYGGGAAHALPPHVYGVAAGAWRRARDLRRAAAVVVTGESGAGKTEAARLCLQAWLLAAPPHALLAALPAAGTLLEAFGNASTQRNHNASRFGTLLEIELDFKGEPRGAHVAHYTRVLQERVHSVPEGERNYHVLYQLLAGADAPLLRRLRLQRSWEHYRILAGGGAAAGRSPRPPGAPRDPRPHDAAHFEHTTRAMRALGLRRADRDAVLRVLAFLLKLGNVHFEPRHDVDGSIGTRVRREEELREACALVGVDAEALAGALAAPHAAEEDDEREPDEEWARAPLERLLGATYARLFAWLVRRANAALAGPGGGDGAHVALLDAYGLESLAHNGLARLCINYCAERVQAAVTAATLRREQEAYAREGLAWRPLRYRDTEPLAAALERCVLAPLGARAPPPLAARLAAAAAAEAPPRHVALTSPTHFAVEHFGGWVEYSTRGMVAADRDEPCRRCERALAAASEPLLAELFAERPESAPRAGLLARQRALVGALVRRLPPAPALVRCLRNDARLRPRAFDAALVRDQLASQALVELARLRRAGWAEAVCARELLRRYRPLARAPPPPGAEPVAAARLLLRALPLPPAEFAFGRTAVFVRSPRTLWELEALRAARVERLVAGAQRAWRAHRARVAAGAGAARRAARALWAWWCGAARRRHVRELAARLPARHRSPTCAAWPAPRWPAQVGAADALLRRLHHAWRCREYRAAFDQAARNRMREKVTASALFRGRKATYAAGVAHPFVGDYVRLRASCAWRRGAGPDAFVVFAEGGAALGGGGPAVLVLSTAALLLLEARSLRVRRRVEARAVASLALSPLADDVVCVRVRRAEPPPPPPCLPPRALPDPDLVLRTPHAIEFATKLFLVVQNAAGAAPPVEVAPEWSVRLAAGAARVAVHDAGGAHVRVLRAPHRIDVVLEARE